MRNETIQIECDGRALKKKKEKSKKKKIKLSNEWNARIICRILRKQHICPIPLPIFCRLSPVHSSIRRTHSRKQSKLKKKTSSMEAYNGHKVHNIQFSYICFIPSTRCRPVHTAVDAMRRDAHASETILIRILFLGRIAAAHVCALVLCAAKRNGLRARCVCVCVSLPFIYVHIFLHSDSPMHSGSVLYLSLYP